MTTAITAVYGLRTETEMRDEHEKEQMSLELVQNGIQFDVNVGGAYTSLFRLTINRSTKYSLFLTFYSYTMQSQSYDCCDECNGVVVRTWEVPGSNLVRKTCFYRHCQE
jgi:hypothetical protein